MLIHFYFQYKKKSTHVVERLKDKVEILEAKNIEIELEKKALQWVNFQTIN